MGFSCYHIIHYHRHPRGDMEVVYYHLCEQEGAGARQIDHSSQEEHVHLGSGPLPPGGSGDHRLGASTGLALRIAAANLTANQARKDPAQRCLASVLQRDRTWRHLAQNREPTLQKISIQLHPPGPNRPLTVTVAPQAAPKIQTVAQQLLVPILCAILQVYQIFGVSHITTNLVESENSQIKRRHRVQRRRGAETVEEILTTWWVFEEGFSKGVKEVLRREAAHFSSKWATQNFGRCLD